MDRMGIEVAYSDALEQLAAKCDELDLAEQAALTRQWQIPLDVFRRQILCLPPKSEAGANGPNAKEEPKVVEQWRQAFQKLRATHADKLYAWSRSAAEIDEPEFALQGLFAALREDPNHEAARKALGYRRDGPRWVGRDGPTNARLMRVRHPQTGWASGTYWRIESPRFEIVTSAGEAAGRLVAEELEATAAAWEQTCARLIYAPRDVQAAFNGRPLRTPFRQRHRIVLFRTRDEYNAHLAERQPQIAMTTGIYLDRERVSYFFVYDGAGPPADEANGQAVNQPRELAAFAPSWRHEAVHQLFHETLSVRGAIGVEANFWVLEGIAMYYESLRRWGDYCTLGGFDAERLQYARYRRLSGDEHLPLHKLTSLGQRALQADERLGQLYSQAAGTTQFLLEYEAGKYRGPLLDYLQAVYNRRDNTETLADLTGALYSQLDDEYKTFLNVTDDDLAALERWPAATMLVLAHTSVTDEGMRSVAALENLTWLDLGHTRVTDAGVAQLKSLAKLKELNLEHTAITDASLATVANFTALAELDLTATRATDAGLARLEPLAKLTTLWIGGTAASDAALGPLAKLPALERLDIRGTKITPEAWRQFSQQRPNVKQIE